MEDLRKSPPDLLGLRPTRSHSAHLCGYGFSQHGAATSNPKAVPLPGDTGVLQLRAGHLLLPFDVVTAGQPMSVELWPISKGTTYGSLTFFGCDRSTMV